MPTTVSVITINYNNLEGLQRTAASVWQQDYPAIEYVVIDGGSTDGSKEFIEANAPRIQRWVSKPDKGIYDAQNKGWQLATGAYVIYINSGDAFEGSDVISRLADHAGEYDLVYGNLLVIDYKGGEIPTPMPEILTPAFFERETLSQHVTLIKREQLAAAGGFNTRYKIVADWALLFTIFLRPGATTKYVDVLVSRFHQDGLSSKMKSMALLMEERNHFLQQYMQRHATKATEERTEKSKWVSRWQQVGSSLAHRSKLLKRNLYNYTRFKQKAAPIDYYNIPIVLYHRNRPSFLLTTIQRLNDRGYYNIHIIDDNSGLESVKNLYTSFPYPVFYLPRTEGEFALWDVHDIWDQFNSGYYVYSDCTLCPAADCPEDFMRMFYYLLHKYPSVHKVGFGVQLSHLHEADGDVDIDINLEKEYSRYKMDRYAFHAPIDTGFALYRPGAKGPAAITRCLRTAAPYVGEYLPWFASQYCTPLN